MKIMLYSDVHIDKNFFKRPLLLKEENYKVYNFIIKALELYKPDLQIFLGDMFDVVDNIDIIPYIRVRQFLAGKEKEGVFKKGWVSYSNIYLLPGNHDLLSAESSFDLLHTLDNIFPISSESSSFKTTYLQHKKIKIIPQPDINSTFIFIPYIHQKETLIEVLNKIGDKAVFFGTKNVFVFGHFGIVDDRSFYIPSSEYLMGIVNVKDISPSYFKNITKTYLGHIHKRMNIYHDKISYIGNTHCLTFADENDLERGCLFLDIDSKGNWKEEYYNNEYSSVFYKVKFKDLNILKSKPFNKDRNYYLDIIINTNEKTNYENILKEYSWINNYFKYYRIRNKEFENLPVNILDTLNSLPLKLKSISLSNISNSLISFLASDKDRLLLNDKDLEIIKIYINNKKLNNKKSEEEGSYEN